MENNEKNTGNPKAVNDAVFGSQEDDFFEQLEKSVNGLVHEDPNKTVQDSVPPKVEEKQATPKTESVDIWESDDNPYKKRYSDSSREAIEQRKINKDNERYGALINVMKQDPNVVDVVRNYLESGKQPTSVKEAMGVDEDFVFDPDEAMSNPSSDSARMLEGYVDKVAQKRVADTVQQMQAQGQEQAQQQKLAAEADAFKKRTGMSDEQFQAMISDANSRTLTYDDLHYLVNRDKANTNIAQNAKKDVLNQMKKAQSIPQSASGQGSVQPNETVTHSDKVFDQLRSLDLDLDNLFE